MLKAVFWDVQHGSATYIQTPNHTDIVIDLGSGSVGQDETTFSPLLHLRRKYDVGSLDSVILTHPHRDHLDDIGNFAQFHPKALWRPKHLSEADVRKGNKPGDKEILDSYFNICAEYSNPVQSSPLAAETNGGVSIRTFHPTRCATSNLNNHSIVTVLSYASSTLLIPGDNESQSWLELLEDSSFLQAAKGTDIMLAPHHGREAGLCTELFEHIQPNLIVVSDGPATDTSAVSRYSALAKGWKVHHRSGAADDTRKCVTTRSDGVVLVELGLNPNQKPFMSVTID
jgi:beta-lactamase superfamily II metal-dependent hydrolase